MFIVAHNGARIWGGAERATVSLLKGLKDRGHRVLLLCNDQKVVSESIARGVPAEICVVGGDVALPHAFRLSRVLRKRRPDVFIVGTYKKLFLASLGARLAGVPRIVVRVGLESDTPRSLKYRVALNRWVDGVAVNGKRMVAAFTSLDGLDSSKVRVIWNGVEAHHPPSDPMKLRQDLGIGANRFLIGTVARLARQKRIDRLLEVTSLLPDVYCIIAGDGTRRDELHEKMRALKIEERVRFLGNRDDVGNVFAALDVFVVTSETEGLSNAMLEAMSYGIPVVSTDVSGAQDALAADDDGLAAGVVTDFDPESIAEAIALLQEDPGTRGSMSRFARRRAITRFSTDQMLTAWEEFLADPSKQA
jgi:glycosyltransferase involved in cell wall biosynthesis